MSGVIFKLVSFPVEHMCYFIIQSSHDSNSKFARLLAYWADDSVRWIVYVPSRPYAGADTGFYIGGGRGGGDLVGVSLQTSKRMFLGRKHQPLFIIFNLELNDKSSYSYPQ